MMYDGPTPEHGAGCLLVIALVAAIALLLMR